VSAPLNLARRPFRNERLPTLLVGAACLVLAATTVRHALVARELSPGRARDVASEVGAMEREAEALRAESAELRRLAASPEALKEWAAVKRLVDRRMFSWTGLFAALERALPPGVRLVAVSPDEEEGQTDVALVAVGRSSEDALALMASLQSNEEFERAFLTGWTEGREGFDIQCSVRYAPKARQGGARAPRADPLQGAAP
jgi:Tfp pilus assembly protein PilN